MNTLTLLFRGLEALYGVETGIDPLAHVITYRGSVQGRRELVLVRDADDGAIEIGLALDEHLLERLDVDGPERLLSNEHLADALPVIEGLSHLLYLAEAARRERSISGVELETQAEVDKLAICLLHRWPDTHDATRGFTELVERLYHRFVLVPGLSTQLEQRYLTANRIALAFSRRLQPAVESRSLASLRHDLREFWHGTMSEKQRLAA